ncbi:translation initiation factor IF-2-like [Dioscorea cayenensis subsp. rotundata]|uniref:Translation initiation factor IF-2-like n=1 Tax=Dioscorea cayennensis subsp. rotundata TaxID=55577 RepID=A0AB40CTM1_DIOCR|nr:translation initiation factor IF-2-like [Dioscorea cayenensis subsp. rotundata]
MKRKGRPGGGGGRAEDGLVRASGKKGGDGARWKGTSRGQAGSIDPAGDRGGGRPPCPPCPPCRSAPDSRASFTFVKIIGVRPRTVANKDLTVAFENPDLPLSEDEFRTADIYVEFWLPAAVRLSHSRPPSVSHTPGRRLSPRSRAASGFPRSRACLSPRSRPPALPASRPRLSPRSRPPALPAAGPRLSPRSRPQSVSLVPGPVPCHRFLPPGPVPAAISRPLPAPIPAAISRPRPGCGFLPGS